MNALRPCVYALLLAALLPVCGCARDSGASAPAPAAQPAAKDVPAIPEESDLQALLGKATQPGVADGGASISDRILDGFQAGPSHLRLGDGSIVYWGFKFEEATQQSFVVYDDAGHVRLAAMVDDIVRLTSRGRPRVAGMAAYQEAVERSGLDPRVLAFVRDEGDLATYLPALERWLQADLLGFNVHCERAGMAPACALAGQVRLPLRAYAVDAATGAVRELAVPDRPAAQEPLENFRQ